MSAWSSLQREPVPSDCSARYQPKFSACSSASSWEIPSRRSASWNMSSIVRPFSRSIIRTSSSAFCRACGVTFGAISATFSPECERPASFSASAQADTW